MKESVKVRTVLTSGSDFFSGPFAAEPDTSGALISGSAARVARFGSGGRVPAPISCETNTLELNERLLCATTNVQLEKESYEIGAQT